MLALSRQNLRESVATLLVACLCIAGVGFLQVPQLKQLIANKKTDSIETLKRDIQSEKLRLNLLRQLPSFGFDNLIADWTLITFLQYFGDDQAREKTGYSLSPEYFEVILGRDPRFLQAYLFLSTSTSMYSAMPERSVELMNKGLKSVSPTIPQNSYYIWRYKGIDELLFLADAKAAQQSFATSAQWASSYTDERSKQVAAISQRTAEFLARNPQSKTAQISAWTMVINNAVDQATQKRAINKIEALGGKISTTPEGGFQVLTPKED